MHPQVQKTELGTNNTDPALSRSTQQST